MKCNKHLGNLSKQTPPSSDYFYWKGNILSDWINYNQDWNSLEGEFIHKKQENIATSNSTNSTIK